MSNRTITLTGRTPVTIEEDNWPVIASASDSEHDGQVECQANRKSSWWIKARRNEDGRAIVYAGYSYTSNWQGSRDYAAKRGVLLTVGAGDGARPTDQQICDAIRDVCDAIAQAEHHNGDESRWTTLANECIADMPAEVL